MGNARCDTRFAVLSEEWLSYTVGVRQGEGWWRRRRTRVLALPALLPLARLWRSSHHVYGTVPRRWPVAGTRRTGHHRPRLVLALSLEL